MKKFNYENEEYLSKLNDLPKTYYSKYISFLEKFMNKNSKFLDVGCGNGEVILTLKKNGFRYVYGVDISSLFIKKAKLRGLKNVYSYDGEKFPFKKNYFDVVGSFNVLEHTIKPALFIKKQIEIIKPGGYIIIACPNFLSSIMISPHPRVNGIKRKILNFSLVVKKIINSESQFFTMPVIKRKKFEYDDDAIVVTNLIDIKRCLGKNNCRVVYESGFINYDSGIYKLINLVPVFRYSLPSCFIVAEKLYVKK